MTPAQVIAAVKNEDGTLAERFKALLVALADLTVQGECRPPRCACGATLSVWRGRMTGYTFILHPRNWGCPRDAYRAWAPTPEKALAFYVEQAPDVSCYDAPEPAEEVSYEFEP